MYNFERKIETIPFNNALIFLKNFIVVTISLKDEKILIMESSLLKPLFYRNLNAQLLASGVGVNWAIKAQKLLLEDWGVAADIWSVTSWNELRRDGLEVDRHNMMNPESPRTAYITTKLAGSVGPVIAVSDFMRAVQDQVAPWVANPFTSLGTDGFGLSDTRGALRRHFRVDAESIVVATLASLVREGKVQVATLRAALDKYALHDIMAADPGNTEGSG